MSDGILRCPPGPTDAELQADRDAKHAAAVREWFDRNQWAQQGTEAKHAYLAGCRDVFDAVQELLRTELAEQTDQLGQAGSGAMQALISGQRIQLIALRERVAVMAANAFREMGR